MFSHTKDAIYHFQVLFYYVDTSVVKVCSEGEGMDHGGWDMSTTKTASLLASSGVNKGAS